MPRPCSICSSPHADAVQARVLAGASDEAIAREFGFTRPGMQRHRQNHIQAPARAVAQAAGKGAEARAHREAVMQATAADPAMWATLHGLTAALQKVHDRLDRAAEDAAAAKQSMALASLSGQQTKAIEVAAKLGGIGAEKAREHGGGHTIRIFLGNEPVVIEGEAVEPTGISLQLE